MEFPQWRHSGGQPAHLAIGRRVCGQRPFPSPKGPLPLPGRPPGSLRGPGGHAVAHWLGPSADRGFRPEGRELGGGGSRRRRHHQQAEEELFSGCGGKVLQPRLHQERYRTLVLRGGRDGGGMKTVWWTCVEGRRRRVYNLKCSLYFDYFVFKNYFMSRVFHSLSIIANKFEILLIWNVVFHACFYAALNSSQDYT